MRIKIHHLVQQDHGVIRETIHAATVKVNTSAVEFHVKRSIGYPHCAGVAYSDIPSIARVAKNTKYLVTIRIPEEFGPLPHIWKYPGLKTAPPIHITTWEDDLFHVAAHEAYHVKQFRNQMTCSEVRADQWALARMIEAGRHQGVKEDVA